MWVKLDVGSCPNSKLGVRKLSPENEPNEPLLNIEISQQPHTKSI